MQVSNLINKEKQKFIYLYDFGDGWLHKIILEKIVTETENGQIPRCIAGERACPPEDCGGVWGYSGLMEIKKDKNHPDYEERIIEWLGEDYDHEEFKLEEINLLLKGNKKNSLWNKGDYIAPLNPSDPNFDEKMRYFEEKTEDSKEYE